VTLVSNAIDFSGVSQTFQTDAGPLTALSGVSMSFSQHEFVAILGPSGCGKSTLLRLTAGLIIPSEAKHMRGRVSTQDRAKAREIIATMGLEGFEKQLPGALSGGMQQRVGIARALFLNPEILLMDEPFSALDALTRDAMGFELLRLWQASPKTVMFITHSIPEAVLLADRVLVMSERPGRIIADLPVPLERPRDDDALRSVEIQDFIAHLRSLLIKRKAA